MYLPKWRYRLKKSFTDDRFQAFQHMTSFTSYRSSRFIGLFFFCLWLGAAKSVGIQDNAVTQNWQTDATLPLSSFHHETCKFNLSCCVDKNVEISVVARNMVH
jgi:hypothetical protein